MFPYILKATFCLVLLLGFYHLTLEKEKMHRFNRFYLLGSILFSCLVPSFIITVAPAVLETPVFAGIGILEQISFEATSQQSIDYTDYIIGLYTLVSTILFILLSKKVYDLLNKVKRNQQVNYFSATVVLLKERIVPYTFLHYIFINKFTYQTDSLEEQILTHELAHVQQKHSIDVLFIQVLQNLFWFNPIFRYYKKAIQLNHEFLADDAVINSHKNITEYQQVLLNTTAQNNNIYLASNLNYSLTKKRLLMMTIPSSKTNILLKKLLVAPLVAGFIFAFAQRVEAQEKKAKPQIVEIKLNEKGISKKGMNQYKLLFSKEKSTKIHKHKDVRKMIALYKAMSKKQQRSVTDIRKVLPPPPPKPRIKEVEVMPEVVEIIESSVINEVVELTEVEVMPEVVEVVELQKITNRDPPPPPPNPNASKKEILKAKNAYKAWKKRTGINIPPPPPKSQIKETIEQELKETEKLRITHEKEMKSFSGKPVVTGGRMKISLLETVKMWSKKDARFLYNKKAITAKEAIKIVSENKKTRMYSAEIKGRPTLVYITLKK